MRVGNEFSETNKKLQEAVYSFIEWLFLALGEYSLPGEDLFGWIIRRNKDKQQIHLSFKMQVGGWHDVATNFEEPQMNSIALLCHALAGPEGETLFAWLEKETKERSQLLVALQSGIQAVHSSMTGQGS